MSAPDHSAALARLADFYDTLSEAALPRLGELYAADGVFKDPFNEVRGVAAIDAIFRHMYAQLEQPRFVVRSSVLQGAHAFLVWEFSFHAGRRAAAPLCIRGVTELRFDEAGLVCLHRDYWDAAEELYEKLPLLGGLMRWLRRRLRSPQTPIN